MKINNSREASLLVDSFINYFNFLRYNIKTNCVIPIAASQMTANLLPEEYLKLLDPDHITGIVSYLAHESSAENGSSFEVGGGWYSKIRWQRSAGIRYGTLMNV
jgi:hypothetical protein